MDAEHLKDRSGCVYTDDSSVDGDRCGADSSESIHCAHVHRVRQIITQWITSVNRKPPACYRLAVHSDVVWTHWPVVRLTTHKVVT